jgi:hypothetical protein
MFYGGEASLEEGKIGIRAFGKTSTDGLVGTTIATIG